MFPFQREVQIAISIGSIAVQVKIVLAGICCQVEIIIFIDLMTDIQIHIIKRGPTQFVLIAAEDSAASLHRWFFLRE